MNNLPSMGIDFPTIYHSPPRVKDRAHPSAKQQPKAMILCPPKVSSPLHLAIALHERSALSGCKLRERVPYYLSTHRL